MFSKKRCITSEASFKIKTFSSPKEKPKMSLSLLVSTMSACSLVLGVSGHAIQSNYYISTPPSSTTKLTDREDRGAFVHLFSWKFEEIVSKI